jgi:hypothetical protein
MTSIELHVSFYSKLLKGEDTGVGYLVIGATCNEHAVEDNIMEDEHLRTRTVYISSLYSRVVSNHIFRLSSFEEEYSPYHTIP